jgi:hypothetical protein
MPSGRLLARTREATARRLFRRARLTLPVLAVLALLALPSAASAMPVILDVTFDASGSYVSVNIDYTSSGPATFTTTVFYYHGYQIGTSHDGSPLVQCTGDVTDRYLQVVVEVSDKDGSDNMTVDNAPHDPPHITSIDYNTDHGFGGAGEEVWIRGTGFGKFHDQADVYFMPGSIKATILDWSTDLITLKVPNGAKDGTVHVATPVGPSNDFAFDVISNVTGTVIDGHGDAYSDPLFDARVELKDERGGVLETDYTNEMGYFEIAHELEKDKDYRLTVTLQTEDKKMVLLDYGALVSFTKNFTWTGATVFPMMFNLKTTTMDDASVSLDHLDNLGALWHYLMVNRQVAQLSTRDLPWKLTVHAYFPDHGAWYDLGSKTIVLTTEMVNDSATDKYPPPWDFKKNRESHEFGHALMHYALGGSWVALPNVANHAGYINSDTGDSLSEGFAEFWTMYVDTLTDIDIGARSDEYDGWGCFATGDRRMAWSPMVITAPTAQPPIESEEEFAVAGLLYRLWVLLGQDTAAFNQIVEALPVNGTLTDFFEGLSAVAGANAGEVRQYFTQQGFFQDTDGDWAYDAGEAVGAGNGANCKIGYGSPVVAVDLGPRLTRRQHPFPADSFVGVDLKGVTAADAESWVTVTVTHPDKPAADYSDRTLVTGGSGLVFAYLDQGSNATVTVKGPDHRESADKLTFTYDQWMAARENVAEGAAVTKTFTVTGGTTGSVVVGTPTGPKTLRLGKAATYSGTLSPKHTAGTYPVLIYKYLQVGKKWKAKGSVKAKAADFGDASKYSAKIKLTVKGKWKLRAKTVADAEHKATWSKGYKIVTVR